MKGCPPESDLASDEGGVAVGRADVEVEGAVPVQDEAT